MMTLSNRIIILLLCFSTICAGASAQIITLGGWVNHYPGESLGPNGNSFFDLPEVQQPLQKLLPKTEYNNLVRDYGMQAPIHVVGNLLVVIVCKQHWCPDENAFAIFGLNDKSIVVMFYDDTDGKKQETATKCFSTGPTIASLPDIIKEDFLDRHIMRMSDKELLPDNLWLNNIACKGQSERIR